MPLSGFGLPDLNEEHGNSASSAPSVPRDVHELWWDQYKDADGPGRLAMTREKLASLKPDDPDYETYFPQAIDDLEPLLGPKAFVAFLEDLERDYPEAFADNLDWHSFYIIGVYANDARWDQLERVVERLADRLTELTPPLPAILSQLRLCNCTAAAGRLLDAVKPFVADPDVMPHASNQYIEWLLFGAYQRCLERGASDDEIEAVYRFSLTLGATESEDLLREHRDVIRRLAGQEPRWTREELKPGDEVGRRVYLLLVDFQKWLQQERGCAAMVADELRRVTVHAIDGTRDMLISFLDGLRRVPFETFLVRDCLGFMSLTRFYAPASVCAMYHFYEFLYASNLVKSRTRDVSQLVCCDLWADLRKAAKTEWEEYRFLENCFPGDQGSFFPVARGQTGQESPI
jgi:hypothetical protein